MKTDQVQRAKARVVKRGLLEHVERALDAAKASGDLADAEAVATMVWFGIRVEREGLKPATPAPVWPVKTDEKWTNDPATTDTWE